MTLMTQAEFARHIGHDPAHVTRLKQRGQLVMRAGKVDVEESQKLIEQLKDPSKQGVVDRHAQVRAQKQAIASANSPAEPFPIAPQEYAGSVYQQSRALKEKYNAMAAKRDYELSIGKLLVAEQVVHTVANAAAVVRQRLESMPDILLPQCVAETDEQRRRALFLDHIEQLLSEMSRQFAKLTKEGGAVDGVFNALLESENDA